MQSASSKYDWTAMSQLEQDAQDEAATAAYAAIADFDEADRRTELASAIEIIYRLPDPQLRSMTEARLRAWLALPPEKAAIVGNSFESVMDAGPADIAMRRVTVVQSVAFKLTPEEIAQLRNVVPRVLGDAPPPTASMSEGTGAPPPPWWAFWRKRN
ncbi:MAG: hypothetical protein KC495_05525 [Dehalococcoidia bacterium]|nr:hypothetical protein [Dehalococcoidia bacterium]MCA9829909.1 hypothetical protein [Dehalococcoidia bacterium]MCB9486750.1 hypothetical protein [Thermoflexaceae bacterium]